MGDDRLWTGLERGGERVDIGARQGDCGHRDVVIADPERLGEPARIGGRQLAGVFAVRSVVDDRAYAGLSERLDRGTVESAGGAQAGGKFGQGGQGRRQ
jgi:D-arabinose 1-dehydrogenase-like Zn-dependent alcohol dehydrogenase